MAQPSTEIYTGQMFSSGQELSEQKNMSRQLSYTEMKHEIFDYLAQHFEEKGTTTNVSLDEIVLALGQKPIRVKRAVESLIDENVLIADVSEPENYRLSPTAYAELVQELSRLGRLPDPPDDAGKNFSWMNEGHAFVSPVETSVPIHTLMMDNAARTPSEAVIKALHAKATALNLELIEFEGVNDTNLPVALEALNHSRSSLDKSGDKSAITGQPELGIRLIVRRTD